MVGPFATSFRMMADVVRTGFEEFIKYFSEWRHAKLLVGTCMCWFLLDIAYVNVFSLLTPN